MAAEKHKEVFSLPGDQLNPVPFTVLAGYEEDFESPTFGQDGLPSKSVIRKRKRSLALSTVKSDALSSVPYNVSDYDANQSGTYQDPMVKVSDALLIGQTREIGENIPQTIDSSSNLVPARQDCVVALISGGELKGPPSTTTADFENLTALPSTSPDPGCENQHEYHNLNKGAKLNIDIKVAAVRCQGFTKSGKACGMHIRFAGKYPFCTLHEWQQQGSREDIRTCDGETKLGLPCKAQILYGPMLGPAFCHLHREQKRVTSKFVCCFGKKSDGSRCHAYIEWKAPFFQFCTEHKGQAISMTCPLLNLPSDVGSMVISLLQPFERVSFALSSKACASFLKEWGQREQKEEKLPSRYKSINLFGPHCTADQEQVHNEIRSYPRQHKFLRASSHGQLFHYRIPPTELAETYEGDRLPDVAEKKHWVAKLPACSCGYKHQLTEIHNHLHYRNRPSPMQKAIRTAPWLFNIASNWMKQACIACGTPPSQTDKDWYDGRYGTSGKNPEVFLCRACETRRQHIAIRWCAPCKGHIPSVTACARAYWKAQPPNNIQDMDMTDPSASSKPVIVANASVASGKK